jgi:hypothetical protein
MLELYLQADAGNHQESRTRREEPRPGRSVEPCKIYLLDIPALTMVSVPAPCAVFDPAVVVAVTAATT